MRFPTVFSPAIKIMLWLMFGISVVATVFAALIVCGVDTKIPVTVGQATPTLFSSTFVAAVSLLLATVHYKVTETHLRLKLAFFDILGGRIRIENILNIVQKDGKMYISYLWQGGDPVIAQISIAPKHYEKMKTALMSQNKNIVFFDEDKKDEER